MSLSSRAPNGLRDPTREELFNGPTREKLPVEIQQMAPDDTACTFCGVSYFVFSEVQELQAAVKQYKQTFHAFVRFMERERKISQDLRAQVVTLQRTVNDGVATARAMLQRVALESQQLHTANEQLTKDLQNATTDKLRDLAQWRRAEEEWQLTSALTEQKLRNEILHLTSDVEKCRLLSTSQEAEFQATLESERTKIKELEVVVATARASMAAAERLVVTERDERKQQLFAANERVEMERATAKQLETQLRAVQQELQRVVASSDTDRAAFAQLQNDLATLKRQLLQHEKTQATLATERADVHAQLDQSNEVVRSLRAEVATLEAKVHTNAVDTEKRKQEYARELEKIRMEHGQAINRMQRDHQKALDNLKQQQATYIEYLEKQTKETAEASASTLQQALVAMEDKLRDADKQLVHTKTQLKESGDELQQLQQSLYQATTRTQALERHVADAERDKKEVANEMEQLQRRYDRLHVDITKQIDQVQRETKAQFQRAFDEQKMELQRKVGGLQTKCDQLRRENEHLAKERKAHDPEDDGDDDTPRRTPQQAWGDGLTASQKRASTRTVVKPSNNNQDRYELERLVESLRQTVDQKDKEILLLQQTVHRECLERTSLLEKMKSGKVLPDLGPSVYAPSSVAPDASERKPSMAPVSTHGTDPEEHDERETNDGTPSQPKASLYERLRRAGHRKPNARKS